MVGDRADDAMLLGIVPLAFLQTFPKMHSNHVGPLLFGSLIPLGRLKPAGQGTCRLMEREEPENVISTYTDAQALDDSVLVAIQRGPVNRVTRAVFDHFTAAMGDSPVTGPVTDVTRLMRAVESMLTLDADGDGWRTGAYEGKTLWLVPNEVKGLTLMFPDDY